MNACDAFRLGLIPLVLAAAAAADCPPTVTLTPTTPYFQQTFGSGAAFHLGVDGTSDLLIGAPRDTVGNTGFAGSVSVFHYDGATWAFSQLLTAPAGASCDFGTSIEISGDSAIIGASGSDGGCDDGGAIYYTHRDFQTGVWSPPVRYVAPGTETSDWVGRSVSIDDLPFDDTYDFLVAGAYNDGSDLSLPVGEETQASGAVYVWRRFDDGPWQYLQKLRRTAPTNALAANQQFGSSVAVGGGRLIAGAPGGELNVLENGNGLVMVYGLNAQNQWVSYSGNGYHHPLTAPQDGYGSSVANYAGVMAVGAPRGDSTAADTPMVGAKVNCGYVEVLLADQNGVQSGGRIFAPDAANNDGFGYSVHMGPLELIVGTAVPHGKVYVYRKSGNSWNQWTLARVLRDDTVNTSFGATVASTYGWIASGNPGYDYDQNGFIKGIAYVYRTNQYTDAADTCARAVYNPLYAEGTYTGCSSDYTLGAYSTCGGTQSAQGPDLFYAYIPRCSGPMVADTIGSAFDTVLSVHSACPPDINPNNPNALTNTIACNDDIDIGNGNTQSRVFFNAVEGQTYVFRISGYNGASGDYVFSFRALTPPANDNCTQAQVVGLGATPFVTCGASTDGPTDGITCGIQPTNSHRDVWFRYTPASPGTVTADTCDSNFNNMIQVFTAGACPAANTEALACGYDNGGCQNFHAARTSFGATPGIGYLIRISSPNVEIFATTGYGTLNLSFLPARCPCDWNQSGAVSVQDIFDFLAGYFAGYGDFNNSGATSVQDIFDFLACYFNGC